MRDRAPIPPRIAIISITIISSIRENPVLEDVLDFNFLCMELPMKVNRRSEFHNNRAVAKKEIPY